MAVSDVIIRRMQETLDVLAGNRGDKTQAAVRFAQLGRIQELLADFDRNAETLARAISKELSDSIANLQARDGQHDEQIAALQQAVKSISDSSKAISDRVKAVEDALALLQTAQADTNKRVDDNTTKIAANADAAATNALGIEANAKALSDTKAAAKAVVIPAITSAQVSAAPTAAQFNALQKDAVALQKALTDMRSALST